MNAEADSMVDNPQTYHGAKCEMINSIFDFTDDPKIKHIANSGGTWLGLLDKYGY